MKTSIRNRYFLISDILLLPCAAYLSYVLRLEDFDIARYLPGLILFTGLSLLILLLVFIRVGIYARYWNYASVEELILLSGSVTVATFISGILALAIDRTILIHMDTAVVPLSLPGIFLLLALAVTAIPRLAVRMASQYENHPSTNDDQLPALIMGAGSAGSMMVRELRKNPQLGMDVVGFVDDNPAKRDMRIHGVPVLGNRQDIPALVARHNIRLVIIAMPTAPGKTIRTIVDICEQAGVRTKIIPGMYELLDGKVSVNQLRDVEIEDLLRRQPVHTDIAAVKELIYGKCILVTGGGGSIGSELCRQLLRCKPAKLVFLGHGENSIFVIQNELSKCATNDTLIKAVIADIRFIDRIRDIFEEHRPDIVFHAAAHKHVPLMELNPVEAITNNVLGTRNLLEVALATHVQNFVLISSDKAVNPTSIMGASKRAAELLVLQAAKTSGRSYVAVRFGNVLGSRGSVVLTFKQQIAAGGPITVTDPEMRRYFMTIPEATQLVLQAATLGQGGEVFTLDMGEPIRIVDLARDMIELSGLEVGRDIDIVFTGQRPGEKLYEELFVHGEAYERTIHDKIFIACNASNFVPMALEEAIEMLEISAQCNDQAAIRNTLQILIPEMRRPVYKPEKEQEEDLQIVEPLFRVVGG